jgi:hypothetical protein
VNTITYSVPAGVFNSSVTGTTAVSITLGLLTQTANYVWAGPVSGAAAGPTFRALVAADIPSGLPISTISGLQSQLDNKLNNSLNDGEIFIGSIANGPAMKTLDGDITMTREGFVTISGESVTFSKMQEITSGTLLGRWGAADPGPVQEVGLSADFVLDSGTGILSLAVPVAPILDTKGSLITYTSATGTQVQLYAGTNGQILIPNNTLDEGLEWVDISGDITLDTATPSGAATISAGAVTLAKMANLAANSFIGNNTGSSATPIALTATQATAMLDQFTTSAKGLVPAASGGLDATYFLNALGGWTVPAGGGGGGTTTNALTIGSGLSGSPASTFNGSAAITVTLNTGNANTWTALQTFESNIYLGAAGGSAGSARFRGSTSGYVILQAPAAPANQTYLLPAANGTTGQFLKLSDSGTGQLAWDTAGGGSPAGADGQIQYNNGGSFGGVNHLTWDDATNVLLLKNPTIGGSAGNGHFHMHSINASAPSGVTDYITVYADKSPKQIGARFETDAYTSALQFGATADRVYSLPDATGNVLVDTVIPSLNNGTSAGEIRFKEATANGSNYVAIKSPASLAGDYSLTLPIDDGVDGQVLKTDGSGVLSWVNAGPLGTKYISTTAVNTLAAGTAFTVFVSLEIPANTFGSGSIFRILQRTIRPTSATAATIRLGFNTAISTSGANMVWLSSAASTINAGAFTGTTQRHISIEGTTTSYYLGGWGSASNDDVIFAYNPSQTTAIDWTVTQYLIIGASTGASDSMQNIFTSISPLS